MKIVYHFPINFYVKFEPLFGPQYWSWCPKFNNIESSLYIKIWCKYWYFWCSYSWKEEFLRHKPYFYCFVFIFLFKRVSPFILKIYNPIPEGCFVPSLVKSGIVVLEKKSKCEKFANRWTDRQIDIKFLLQKIIYLERNWIYRLNLVNVSTTHWLYEH